MMQNTLTIPTQDDIKAAVREELTAFFSNNPIFPQPDADEIGGIDLAVSVTGLSKPTVYTKVSLREIPHSKQGKRLYFSRRELLAWIADGRRKTQAEIAQEAAGFSPKKTNRTQNKIGGKI